MDVATSLENCLEICGENSDRISSILIVVVDMAVTIRRMKTMLCRSNSKISLVFFNGTTIQTNFCCVLIFRQMMGKHQIFYFPFRENSFISKK